MRHLLGLPADASDHGIQFDMLTLFIHGMMLALFLGWSTYFVIALIRYRRSRSAQANYQGVRSRFPIYLVFIVAIIEGVLLVGYSLPLWDRRMEEFPPEKDSVVIKVVGEQFAWNIHYAGADGIFGKQDVKFVASDNPLGLDKDDPRGKDDIITVNQMYIPVNKPVIVHVGSKDVIHSFALQHMRVKQDAIPGSSIPLWFVARKTSAEIQEEMRRSVPTQGTTFGTLHVAMQDYEGIVRKGQMVTDKPGSNGEPSTLSKLAGAGIHEVLVAPATPTEITCAQLCGLGHYRMRGYYTVVSEAEFQKWLAEKAEALSGGGYE